MAGYDHLIMGTSGSNMEAILRNFKSFTSKELKEAIKISAKKAEKYGWFI